LVSFSQEKEESLLTVQFDNIRNNDGTLYVFIYNYENQYPDNPYLNFEIDKNLVSKFGTLKFTIPNILAKGEYGISILDDENANEDLDLFFGLPKEGFAFSNNVVPFLSMPDYSDIIFDLSDDKKTVFLTLQYIL
jgi:uncharacterized protein (DUF2141 family)